jgi:hypothetical protein
MAHSVKIKGSNAMLSVLCSMLIQIGGEEDAKEDFNR